ncbi:MAG: hypothetical protein GX046_10025, partial [Tissierellia bacterium]|nr:hypothetical protein [Tissierellia bacterium]
MKKAVVSLLIGLLMLGLVACGSESKDATQAEPSTKQEPVAEDVALDGDIQEPTELAPEEIITPEITMELERLRPLVKTILPIFTLERINTDTSFSYFPATAKYKNTLDLPIVSYFANVTLKDVDESFDYDMEFTVLPGETSPIDWVPWPESEMPEDYLVNNTKLIVQNEDGSRFTFIYDANLDTLTEEISAIPKPATVDISDLLPALELVDSDANGTELLATLKNTTDLPIISYSATFFAKDTNEVGGISYNNETILPGEISTSTTNSILQKSSELANDMDFRTIVANFLTKEGEDLKIVYDKILNSAIIVEDEIYEEKAPSELTSEIERLKPLIKNIVPTFSIKSPGQGSSEGSSIASFENSLDLPIVSYRIYTTLKDTNESSVYMYNFTVLPEEKSANFSNLFYSAQGPQSGLLEDIA